MHLHIARQPVFDRAENLFAYDLAAVTSGRSGIRAQPSPEALIAELFGDVGIDRVAPDQRVFIPLDASLLFSQRLPALPAERVILDVPATLSDDPRTPEACHALRKSGYRVASHATPIVATDRLATLAELAEVSDVMAVDVAELGEGELETVAGALREHRARLLALNVGHRVKRDECLELGFDLFRGYRFAAPEAFPRKPVPIQHLHVFRLLQLVRDLSVSDEEIELFLRRDVGLSYQLLRMVNSAAVAGRDISSIGHALRLLGRESLARWLCVMIASQAPERGLHAELVHLALVRARMSERIADAVGMHGARGSAFLVGMLSVFDQLLGVQMDTLCDSVGLASDLRAALTWRAEFLGMVLRLVESYAGGAWMDAAEATSLLRLDPAELPELYVEALEWASGGCGPRRSAAQIH